MGMFDYIRLEGHVLPGLDPNLFEREQDDSESPGQEPAVFQNSRLFERIGQSGGVNLAKYLQIDEIFVRDRTV